MSSRYRDRDTGDESPRRVGRGSERRRSRSRERNIRNHRSRSRSRSLSPWDRNRHSYRARERGQHERGGRSRSRSPRDDRRSRMRDRRRDSTSSDETIDASRSDTSYLQWNLVNTNTFNTNFWIIGTKILRNSGPYNDFSIDFTSFNKNSG